MMWKRLKMIVMGVARASSRVIVVMIGVVVMAFAFTAWRLRADLAAAPPVLGVLLVVVAALALLWWGPQWQGRQLPADLGPKDRADLINEYRRTLAQIIGGVGLLTGLFFTWQQFQLQQSGQITDRFWKAAAQLGEPGDEKLPVRLGGIYALERLMTDSPRDRWTIIEVLLAFVKNNSRANTQKGNPPVSQDVQAGLTVLGRRSRIDEPFRLDLAGVNLAGANLVLANLTDANLTGVNLTGANLTFANLTGALLTGATLTGATLDFANLTDIRYETWPRWPDGFTPPPSR